MQQPRSRLTWVWWIIAIGLLLWNVALLLPGRQSPQVTLPYSVFVAQVRGGNVEQVRLQGNQISGELKTALAWPPPTATAVATTGPQTGGPLSSLRRQEQGEPRQYTAFNSTFPEAVGDPTLMPLLQEQQVQVDVQQPSTPWLGMLVTYGLPFLLLIGFLIFMARQMSQGQSGVFNFGRSRARRYSIDRPRITFNDVAGADEAKLELGEVVDFLRNPAKYHDLGARIPRGVLLVGQPGTGKTLMARAVAGEANVPFFSLSASEFVEMFVGVGASRVRDLFAQAKETAPSIVFVDELDAVGRRRGAGIGNINDEREQTLNQLLVEMDGFDERQEVILLAATNRPDVLDPALLRPGRFDRQVVIGVPDRQGREGILKIHTRDLHLAPDVDLALLARTTTGLSGADLANLCNEAALVAARHNHMSVKMADFDEALDKVLLGAKRALLLNDNERCTVAYHEAGHALVAWLTPDADPVHKVTIVARGQALGVTEQLPGEDHYNYGKQYLLARLTVMLGGRTAEEIALSEITTGAENDLVEATRLARRMVTRWGMGSLGLLAFEAEDRQPFLGYELSQGRDYSEVTSARIDRDVERLLEDRHETAFRLLQDAHAKLDELVALLLKEETVGQAQMAAVLGPRAVPAPGEASVKPPGLQP